jgi:predicted Zn-dependent protease
MRPATQRYVKVAQVASAVVGIWGGTILYRTAELGGQIVYKYAGGPGLRSGESADIERLLLAGLYNQSVVDRRAERLEDAARLVDEMARRFPSDTTVQFLLVESQLRDRKDPAAAQATLAGISLAPTDARLGARRANLAADIWLAMQQPDSAKAALDAAIAAFPQNTRLKARRDSMP